MKNKEHAFLSASSAHRWLVCTASPTMCKNIPKSTSDFAEEGTTAHELAESILKDNAHGAYLARMSPFYDTDMETYVGQYVEYVKALTETYTLNTPLVFVEQKVSFSAFVPDGFGTVDYAVYDIDNDMVHIVDFKYGRGVEVSAVDNPQMKLYALGLLIYLFPKYRTINPDTKIKMTIFQPRINNISHSEMSLKDLTDWGNSIASVAKKAFRGEDVETIPGEHCKFCQAKNVCTTYAKYMLAPAMEVFGKQLDVLTDSQLAFILDRTSSYVTYCKDLTAELIERIKLHGDVKGYSLKESKGKRILTDEGRTLLEQQGVQVYKQTNCSLTEIEKKYGKSIITDDMIDYGKPSYRLVRTKEMLKEVFNLG